MSILSTPFDSNPGTLVNIIGHSHPNVDDNGTRNTSPKRSDRGSYQSPGYTFYNSSSMCFCQFCSPIKKPLTGQINYSALLPRKLLPLLFDQCLVAVQLCSLLFLVFHNGLLHRSDIFQQCWLQDCRLQT